MMNTSIMGICIGLLFFNIELILGNELTFIDTILKKTKTLRKTPEIKGLWKKINKDFIPYKEKRERITQKSGFFENVDHTVAKRWAEAKLAGMENWSEAQLNQPSTKQALKEFQMTNEAYIISEELKEMLLVILQDIESMLTQILSSDHDLGRPQVRLFELAISKVTESIQQFDQWTKWCDFYSSHFKFITAHLARTDINKFVIPSDDSDNDDDTEYADQTKSED